MPVVAQINTMVINSGGPNIIGNEEEQPEPHTTTQCYPGNTLMEGEESSIPASLIPPSHKSSVKTRKERKQN